MARMDEQAPRMESQLGAVTGKVHDSIDTLATLVEDLGAHLECLLSSPHPSDRDVADKEAKAPDHSSAVNKLYDANYKVLRLQDRLRDMIERLEV